MNPIEEKLRALIENEVQEGHLGGAHLQIIKDGKPIISKMFGTTREDAIYRLFSMTKPMTSLLVAMAIAEGKLKTSDRVCEYLPGFAKHPEMTILDCWNMSSGLGYQSDVHFPDPAYAKIGQKYLNKDQAVLDLLKTKDLSTHEIADLYGDLPLYFEPGQGFHYSISADILGAILEVVYEKPLEGLYQERIFDPCGMSETRFYIPPEDLDRLDLMYTLQPEEDQVCQLEQKLDTESEDTGIMLPQTDLIRTHKPAFTAGGAGAYSTVADYQKFADMLLNKGKVDSVQVIDPKVIEIMTAIEVPDAVRKAQPKCPTVGPRLKGYIYSHLLRIAEHPEESDVYGRCGSVGEFGWDGLPGNYFYVDPKENLTFLFMIQQAGGADRTFRSKMRRILYDGLQQEKEQQDKNQN